MGPSECSWRSSAAADAWRWDKLREDAGRSEDLAVLDSENCAGVAEDRFNERYNDNFDESKYLVGHS